MGQLILMADSRLSMIACDDDLRGERQEVRRRTKGQSTDFK
jgi:hypothetical protein